MAQWQLPQQMAAIATMVKEKESEVTATPAATVSRNPNPIQKNRPNPSRVRQALDPRRPVRPVVNLYHHVPRLAIPPMIRRPRVVHRGASTFPFFMARTMVDNEEEHVWPE